MFGIGADGRNFSRKHRTDFAVIASRWVCILGTLLSNHPHACHFFINFSLKSHLDHYHQSHCFHSRTRLSSWPGPVASYVFMNSSFRRASLHIGDWYPPSLHLHASVEDLNDPSTTPVDEPTYRP